MTRSAENGKKAWRPWPAFLLWLIFPSFAWSECPTCGNCPAPVISSSSTQVPFNGTQVLQASGGAGGPYSWTLVLGDGSLSSTAGGLVTYTAPSANADCLQNPSIVVRDACGKTAEISLSVSVPPASFDPAGRMYSEFRGRVLGGCSCSYSWVGISCDGRVGWVSHGCSPNPGAFCGYPPPPPWEWFDYLDHVWSRLCSEAAAACDPDRVCIDGYIEDLRTADQKLHGCCPAQLANCLGINGWSADASTINVSAGQAVHFSGHLPSGATGWRIIIGDWVSEGNGITVSASWNGTNAAGKHVPAGDYTARLEAGLSGERCVRSIPLTVTESPEKPEGPGPNGCVGLNFSF